MKIFNNLARELLELSVGDSTTDWGDGLGEHYPVNFKLVHAKLIDTSRWSTIYERVYEDLATGKFYHTTYRQGATECQDERPYEYDGEEIEFTEVRPIDVITTEYVRV